MSRELGIVRTLEDLHAIMRARALEMQVTLLSVGRAAMLPTRYANKVLAPHPSKKLGHLSIPGLLEALQMELVAVERADVPQRIMDKLDKHQMNVSQRSVRHVRMVSKRFLRKIAKKGGCSRAIKLGIRARRKSAKKAGRARMNAMTPQQRRDLAQMANVIRWSKMKEAVK